MQTPHTTTTAEIPEEPLRYLAGYVAFKLKVSYPDLGQKTGLLNPLSEAPTWIDMLSKGGLMTPTEKLFSAVIVMEERFLQYFWTEGFHTCPNIIQKLIDQLSCLPKCAGILEDAIKLFARMRVFITLRDASRVNIVKQLAIKNARKTAKFVKQGMCRSSFAIRHFS